MPNRLTKFTSARSASARACDASTILLLAHHEKRLMIDCSPSGKIEYAVTRATDCSTSRRRQEDGSSDRHAVLDFLSAHEHFNPRRRNHENRRVEWNLALIDFVFPDKKSGLFYAGISGTDGAVKQHVELDAAISSDYRSTSVSGSQRIR